MGLQGGSRPTRYSQTLYATLGSRTSPSRCPAQPRAAAGTVPPLPRGGGMGPPCRRRALDRAAVSARATPLLRGRGGAKNKRQRAGGRHGCWRRGEGLGFRAAGPECSGSVEPLQPGRRRLSGGRGALGSMGGPLVLPRPGCRAGGRPALGWGWGRGRGQPDAIGRDWGIRERAGLGGV